MRMLFMMILAMGLFGTCDKKADVSTEPGTVNFRFKAVFGDEPLQMYERSYAYEEGMEVRFQAFNFYVSEIALVNEGSEGKETELVSVDLINFEDVVDESTAREGIGLSIKDVPPGNYSGINLGLGLTKEQNAGQPGDYRVGHPLTENYWSWAMGYVFFKIEGNADLNGDGDFTEKLTFHIGGDDYYQALAFPGNLVVESNKETNIEFEIDLRRVLMDGKNKFLDFREVTQDHTNDPDLAHFLTDNFRESIQLEK